MIEQFRNGLGIAADFSKMRAESLYSLCRTSALQERGLIHPTKSRDPLTVAWRLKKKQP
jgi:hypothetical protein